MISFGSHPGAGSQACVERLAPVLPGDWILADRDGVLALPDELARHVSESFDAALEEETFCRRLLERGHALAEAFPMPASLRPVFERYRNTGRLPSVQPVRNATASR